jgi:serine/threonine protein kinase
VAAGAQGPGKTDPLVGQVFADRFRVEARLGQGGMGAVYRAHQLTLGRKVVIKVLELSGNDPELDEMLVQRFKREATVTSRLSHPNTVGIIDSGETPSGALFIAYELLRGETLEGRLLRVGRLDSAVIASIVVQICRSLGEAHDQGVIHRDLKPANVFLALHPGEPDVVKVLDFGVARLVAPTDTHVTQITKAGLTVGTPMYIAPEQAIGAAVDAPTDLYALGVLLFELITGEPPFDDPTPMGVALKHVRQPPPPLYAVGLPRTTIDAWQPLVSALLSKKPEDRPQSALEVIGRVEKIAEALSRKAPVQQPAADVAPTDTEAPRATGPATDALGSKSPRASVTMGPSPDEAEVAPWYGTPGVLAILTFLAGLGLGIATGI